MDIKDSLLIEMYKNMLRIRFFEERVMDLFKRGKIYGAVHLYIGEEAIAVGACSTLLSSDYITGTHRGHGHVIAKGGDLNRMMAELFGKSNGYCGGKAGSLHICDTDLNMLGANGIVGGGIALATGAALSIKLRKSNGVAASFFGDGATNQGTFHESLNMAGAEKLPVIYICENNLYSVFTSGAKVRAIESIASRASSYGFEGITVNGNDVIEVYKATATAVSRARNNEGPTLIVAQTYRHRGHFEGDMHFHAYRPLEEEKKWLSLDPISNFEQSLMNEFSLLSEDQIKNSREEIKIEIDKAVEFAEISPWPKEEESLLGVFSNEE